MVAVCSPPPTRNMLPVIYQTIRPHVAVDCELHFMEHK
jgi:hypothetical protein